MLPLSFLALDGALTESEGRHVTSIAGQGGIFASARGATVSQSTKPVAEVGPQLLVSGKVGNEKRCAFVT